MKPVDFKIFDNYSPGDSAVDQRLHESIKDLARRHFDSWRCSHKPPLGEEFFEDTADTCIIKLSRFDSSKGKMSNFFSTIIGCLLSQERGIHKQKVEMSRRITDHP